MLLLLRTTGGLNTVIVGLAIFGMALFLSYIFAVQRMNTLKEVAATFGFLPCKEPTFAMEAPLMKRQVSLSNIFAGTMSGMEAMFFDVRVGQGKNVVLQTVAAFRRPGTSMPRFQLHASSFGDRLAAHFSDEIIPIDTDAAFAQRYTVRSVCKEECQSFFSPMVAVYFAQLPPHKFTIEGGGDTLLLYEHSSFCQAPKIGEFMNATANIATGLFAQVYTGSLMMS